MTEKKRSNPSGTGARLSFMKHSRAKLWVRTVILTVFGTLFGIYLYRDIAARLFQWYWGLAVLVAFLPVGFWMRQLVPMHTDQKARQITLSFDRIYFALIWLLVAAKAIFGQLLHWNIPSDILMCMILGLMTGRLSGICLRVHGLKQENGFIAA